MFFARSVFHARSLPDILYWFIRHGEDAQQIVSRHIKLLHRYNEAKDATQVPAITYIAE